MNGDYLRRDFKCSGVVVLPVIHVIDFEQTQRNIDVVIDEGAPGCFLINHDFGIDEFLPIIKKVRENYPTLWFGVNFLGESADRAIPILDDLQEVHDCDVDAYWADNARIDESAKLEDQIEAAETSEIQISSDWQGLYFGGVAFKKQREVDFEDLSRAAEIAANYLDIIVTSGEATGTAAPIDKIREIRSGSDQTAVALASGVTPENFDRYRDFIDATLVATGINYPGDFYNIDPLRLRMLLEAAREPSRSGDRSDRGHRWYVQLMAPRSRSEEYAWLDPSSAYINARSFATIIDDLIEPFNPLSVDLVAGIDAAGFILAGGIAVRLDKGVLTMRKGGKTPVAFDVVPMINYSGKTQELEMRKPAFTPGTRVLIVDQWIETGGTMNAAIQLVERQGGIVAGVAAICVEENEATKLMRSKYTLSSCILPGTDLQEQCNRQTLESFAKFDPKLYMIDDRFDE